MTSPKSRVPFWSAVRQLQQQADRRQLDHHAWVADERLAELLARPDRSDLSPEEFSRLGRQAHNRTKKHFRRARILGSYARTRSHHHPPQFNAVDTRDAAEAVRRRLSNVDWVLLRRLAEGADYFTLADEIGILVGTIKARVCRARQQLRSSNLSLAT